MQIKVEKINKDKLIDKGVFNWPIWEKEVSVFDWEYDAVEECFFLEGKVELKSEGNNSVSFGKGDFVTFSKGLKCTWNIKEKVKKHYNFK